MKRALPVALLVSSCTPILPTNCLSLVPSELTYSNDPATYTKGWQIKENAPLQKGGLGESYKVSPTLPVDLSFALDTGIIDGTPNELSPPKIYTVTATTRNGSLESALVIAVVKGSIATGERHTCALIHGAGWCWGANGFGQLGNNSMVDSPAPVQVSSLVSGVRAIAAGSLHTCALVNGGVLCWGDGGFGQLGNNSMTGSSVPLPVSGLSSGVQAIAAGTYHTCALVNGGVLCWGNNGSGQLGNNSTTGSPVPVPVSGLSSGVQAIVTGALHTCALLSGGGVQCWGNNLYGQLGNNSTTRSLVPVPVSGLTSGVDAFAAGGRHTCALVNGGVQCWGDNTSGQLGDGTSTRSLVPIPVAGLTSGLEAITTGGGHTCALVNGGVQCWGDNTSGQLGNNSMNPSSPAPVQVSGLTSGVEAASAGGGHACALISGGIQCWGDNSSGQLGNNSTTTASLVPVPVGLRPWE